MTEKSEFHVKKVWYTKSDDGVWNSMVIIREYDKPLRGRSEVLVINKKTKEVYLSFKDDGSYVIPGGSWEPSKNRETTAIQEAREEARLNITNVGYSNNYVKLDSEPKKWMVEKIPKEDWWYGQYIEVYVGEYTGKYRGYIKDVDKDNMIKTGKFYNIDEVYDKLSPYHRKAIDDYMTTNNIGMIETSLPLPDFQKDIKVGDLSFVYKGVYHPIHWEGDIPYRPRVENIVVKNGREIFLRVYDNPKPGFEYKYRLPGGSLDNDSTKIQQAENETNEEALLKVKNIQYSGIKYFEQFPEGHLLKGGDICLEYKGNVTDVFVSEYNGKFDKKKVEEHDLDDDMANNGKFYHISLHCRMLRPEHVDALLQSDLVDENVKSIMRRVLRGDIEATKKVKDSDMYTELIPNSIVTESSNVHELESVDISSRIFHGSPTQNIKEVKAFHNDRIYSDLGPVIFCSEYKNFAGCYGTRWNDKTMKLYTSFDDGKLSAVSIAVLDKEIMNEWNKPCSLYELENDGNFKRLPNHPCEIINPNSVKVKKEIKFNNFYEMIRACNIEVRVGDDNGLVYVATESYNLHAKGFYHISPKPNLTTLRASVPNNYMTKNGFEDSKTPRVCFSPTVDQCLMALSKNCKGEEFYVYVPAGRYKYHKATTKEVPDSSITGEVWVIESEVVNVKCVGKIRVVGDKGTDGIPYTYGNKTAELYEWDWEPVSEAIITEASTRSKLPDSAFGIPEERKYELDTKKHVLSAIKLFNWVEDKYEKELAQNILKKIDEFDIKEDEIHMTEKNRFYKYYYKTGDEE